MTMLASQITSLTVVYSIVYSGVNQRKHQSSASLAFVREIHRGPVNFPHKWPVTRKMFPFDDVIMFGLAVYHVFQRYITPLTYIKRGVLGRDNMAGILQRTFADLCIFRNEKACNFIKISLKFIPEGPFHSISDMQLS